MFSCLLVTYHSNVSAYSFACRQQSLCRAMCYPHCNVTIFDSGDILSSYFLLNSMDAMKCNVMDSFEIHLRFMLQEQSHNIYIYTK